MNAPLNDSPKPLIEVLNDKVLLFPLKNWQRYFKTEFQPNVKKTRNITSVFLLSVLSFTWIRPITPQESILDATLTVFDQISYLGENQYWNAIDRKWKGKKGWSKYHTEAFERQSRRQSPVHDSIRFASESVESFLGWFDRAPTSKPARIPPPRWHYVLRYGVHPITIKAPTKERVKKGGWKRADWSDVNRNR